MTNDTNSGFKEKLKFIFAGKNKKNSNNDLEKTSQKAENVFKKMKNNPFIFLKITSVFNLLVLFILLLLVSITSINHLYAILHVSPTATDNGKLGYAIFKVYLIIVLVLVIIAATLFSLITFNDKWILLMKDYAFISIFLSVMSINLYGLYFIINELVKEKKNNTNINKKSVWVKFKEQFGIKKWVTFDYVLIALFCGLTLTLAYVEENLLPHMPFGGGLALKYVPLIMISFTTCFLGGWMTGCISALMSLLFIPATNILSPWSFLLDYFVPMTVPALVAFLPFKVTNDKSIFTYINYFLHCFIVFSLIYLSQVLSGLLFWTQQAGTVIWQGYTVITYSLVYNFVSVFILSYPIIQAIVPLLYRSLGSYYLNRYH